MCQMASAPEASVTFLQKALRPVAPRSVRRVSRLVRDLDNDEFLPREAAIKELAVIGDSFRPTLYEGLAPPRSLESYRNLERVLQRLEGKVPPAPRLQTYRAVEFLEYLATPSAIKLLEHLGNGAAGASLTEDSRKALQRIRRERQLRGEGRWTTESPKR
jgi:hypothetical protein